MGAVFTAVFILFGKPLAAIFLQEDVLIRQTGYFLTILCLSAPMLGVINMITSYFQALGEAMKSLTITVLRNAVLFIPGVVLLETKRCDCGPACGGNHFDDNLHIHVYQK